MKNRGKIDNPSTSLHDPQIFDLVQKVQYKEGPSWL